MVIHNFDVIGVPFLPPKAHPVLIVNTNAVLARSIPLQGVQAVRWRCGEISKLSRAINLNQPPERNGGDGLKSPHVPALENSFGVLVAKRANQASIVRRAGYISPEQAHRRGGCKNKSVALRFTTSYLEDSLSLFRHYQSLSERAMAQVSDEQLFTVLDPEMNSIAVIAKHMAGNMLSRWTDFLSADGEKPDRDRDAEFRDPPQSRQALMELWQRGWGCVYAALEPLSDADLGRTIAIRGEAHSVMQAIGRQLAHYAYHCGQIVFLAKHFQSEQWKSLTIPRGQSRTFNHRVAKGEASQR